MAEAGISGGRDVGALVKRLDRCFAVIASGTPERAQAIMYAGFLSDVDGKRLSCDDPNVFEMVGLVGEFCDVIEMTSDTNKRGGQ